MTGIPQVPSMVERWRPAGMYQEHDVLAEVFPQARVDLGNKKNKRMLDVPPQQGTLDINQVLYADYAFA
jgi:hypothetical protein